MVAILADITDDVIRPLLRSAVPSNLITSDFNNSIDATLLDIFNTLNGSNVNLTKTLYNYFLAVSTVYFDEAIDAIPSFLSVSLSIDQTACGVQAVFNHVYTNADAGAKLIDLIQNISQAVRIIKQVHYHYICVYTYLYDYMHAYFIHTILLNSKGSISYVCNFIAINECVSSLSSEYQACALCLDFQLLEIKTDAAKESSAKGYKYIHG